MSSRLLDTVQSGAGGGDAAARGKGGELLDVATAGGMLASLSGDASAGPADLERLAGWAPELRAATSALALAGQMRATVNKRAAEACRLKEGRRRATLADGGAWARRSTR